MPALNFKKEFAGLVELGLSSPDDPRAKRQSIRAYRKDGRDPRPGQPLYLYTGMRTKGCRKLGEAVCTSAWHLLITEGGGIAVDGHWLEHKAIRSLAVADGFASTEDFKNFFKRTHGLPFLGKLIKW